MALTPEEQRELDEIELKELETKIASAAPIQGGTEIAPIESDIYGSDTLRTAASFGNIKGISNVLKQRGFTAVKQDPGGNIIAKDESGIWHKDISGVMPWIQSGVGKTLPMIGGMAGGMAGIPGAAVGAAGGEALRQLTGRYYGTYAGGPLEAGAETAAEAGLGAFGRAIEPGMLALQQKVKPALKRAAAKTSELLTGKPAEMWERFIMRPKQMEAAGAKRAAFETGQAAAAERAARVAEEGIASVAARRAFAEKFGAREIPTTPIIKEQLGRLAEQPVATTGEGALSAEQLTKLSDYLKEKLTTPKMEVGGSPYRLAADLQAIADELKVKVGSGWQKRPENIGMTSKEQGFYKGLYGQVKEQLHKLSPELKAADVRFTKTAAQEQLTRAFSRPSGREAFTRAMMRPNKTAQREAVEQLLPETAPRILDVSAMREYEAAPGIGDWARRAAIFGIGGAAGTSGALQGDPTLSALGYGLSALQFPSVHRRAIYPVARLGAKTVGAAAQKTPYLLPRQFVPWSFLREEEK